MFTKLRENKLARKCILYICDILSCFNKIIPKSDTKILFYNSGTDFLDGNAEAFYNYLISGGFNKKYDIKCFLPKQKDYNNASYKKMNVFEALFTYMTAKYVFFCYGDFRIKPSKNQCVVNLWHGTPLKRIGKATDDALLANEKINNFTYLLTTSSFVKPIMEGAFECRSKQILIAGQPRNDYLLSSKKVINKLGINAAEYKKLILWMPTFRISKDGRYNDSNVAQETMLPIVYTFEDLKILNRKLRENKALLVIKIHPFAQFKSERLSNIHFVTNNDLDKVGIKLYEFVKDFDALLTDYSSIYFDYLLLDRPIGFTLDDYQEYNAKRGFTLENAIDYMPGEHIYTFADMLKYFDDVLQDKDDHKNERHKINNLFNKYQDGRNSERLAEFCGIRI